ncbi:general transcription factor IIIAa [Synchiropus picturatus]
MDPETKLHKRFICSFPNCPAAYNKQWKLDAHLCKHTGVRPHACDHGGCASAFSTVYHLERHKLVHSGDHPFPCTVPDCHDTFTTNANRARHMERVHVKQKKYVCKYEGCGEEFKKNKLLKAHVCERHAQAPAYKCSHQGCEKRFTFPSRLKRHEKVHQGYPCTQKPCTFTGKTWTELQRHRKELHPREVKCDQCDKTFRDSWFLHQHQKVHSDTRQVFQCPRDDCSRSYTTVFNLQSHINSFHEELRPFACTHPGCGRSFSMKKSLQRHTVIHDPERKKIPKPRRKIVKRSLASKLSGFNEKKKQQLRKGQKNPSPAGPVELVSLLQDTSLMCKASVVTNDLSTALTAPLAL